jgi:hypothetical protein
MVSSATPAEDEDFEKIRKPDEHALGPLRRTALVATRYIGDAVVRITYRDQGDYAGSVCAPGRRCWSFTDLRPPAVGFGGGVAYDSPEAYDEMATSAVTFGSYYTSHNRGRDTPDWAPPAEIADAIDEAVSGYQREDGTYEVRRSPGGKAVDVSSPRWRGRSRNPMVGIWGKFGG